MSSTMRRRLFCLLINGSLAILICGRVAYAQTPPYLTLSFNPPNPSIAASAPLGSVVATITATWSDGGPFTGTLSFGPPYSNDNGVFAISGNNLIVNPAGPGISADANTTLNVTVVATDTGAPVSSDGTTLAAPSGRSLTTAAGIWTFGTTQPQPGQYVIYLNGNYVGGWAALMEVNNGGQLYVYNSYVGTWFVWNNGWWYSAAPVSPDGTTLTAPSSGSLTTTVGAWTFGATQSQQGQYEIFLNGNYVSLSATEMKVNNGGQLYVYNSYLRSWYVWNNGWSLSSAPVSNAALASPDGTILTAPSSGSLTTAAGIWTFGTTQPQPGQYVIFLNGNYVGGWAGLMEVDNGGQLYVYNSVVNQWFVWNNNWLQSAAP